MLSFTVENLLDQKPEDMAPPETVQLHNSKIDPRGKSDRKFGRWQPVVIENLTSGGWTIRHARGGQNKAGLTVNSIVLDYDGRVELALIQGQANTVQIRKAKWSKVYRYYYGHKNALTRITPELSRAEGGGLNELLGAPCAGDEIMSDPLTYKIELPIRRYAIFEDLLCGKYTVVVRGADMATAPMWGGFVSWLGGVKEAVSISGKITKPRT